MSNYPYCPKYLRVFWDNGWVALDERDRVRGQLPYNLANPSAQTKRDAILQAREILGFDNNQYIG